MEMEILGDMVNDQGTEGYEISSSFIEEHDLQMKHRVQTKDCNIIKYFSL